MTHEQFWGGKKGGGLDLKEIIKKNPAKWPWDFIGVIANISLCHLLSWKAIPQPKRVLEDFKNLQSQFHKIPTTEMEVSLTRERLLVGVVGVLGMNPSSSSPVNNKILFLRSAKKMSPLAASLYISTSMIL